MTLKAAIYHFTDVSNRRPKIYRDQIKKLKEYAVSLGFEDTDIYCDMSLKRCERSEFDRFLSCCDQYDALVTKDYYHISKNTGKCLKTMQELQRMGIQIYTLEDGIFIWKDAPFDEPLRVATYTCHYGSQNEMKEVISVRNDIFSLFTNKKTNWTVLDQYYDENLRQRDCEQIQMKEIITNRDKYDLLLVHNLNDIHWRTANFCKIREQLQIDIYSLQEGLLEYRKEMQT